MALRERDYKAPSKWEAYNNNQTTIDKSMETKVAMAVAQEMADTYFEQFNKAATEWYNAKYNDTPEAQHDVADKWAKVMEAKRLFDEAMRDLSTLEATETGEE